MKLYCIIRNLPDFNQVMVTFHNGKYEVSKTFDTLYVAKNNVMPMSKRALRAVRRKYADPIDLSFDGTFEIIS